MNKQQPIRPLTIAIAGANGMVGRHLVEALLARGEGVIALVRSPESYRFPSPVDVRRWQASDLFAPVDEADAVVNLVGSPIFAKRWTQGRKQDLIQTRVLATRSLVEGIRKAGGQGRTFISSTAIEYAGNTGDRLIDETATAGKGFLAELSRLWETEAQQVSETGARLVLLRQSLVMGREGGVLAGLLPLSRRVMELMWGERAALFLDTHRMVSHVALSTGFQFRFPTLEVALADLLGPHPLSITQLMNQEVTPGRA